MTTIRMFRSELDTEQSEEMKHFFVRLALLETMLENDIGQTLLEPIVDFVLRVEFEWHHGLHLFRLPGCSGPALLGPLAALDSVESLTTGTTLGVLLVVELWQLIPDKVL